MALYAVLSLDSGHTLKSQTSYPATKFHTALDPDYSAFDIFYVDYHDRYEQFIEEVQFVSPSGQPFEYLAGIYYYRTNAKTDRLARRSAERRVGKEFVSPCRTRWARVHNKNTMTDNLRSLIIDNIKKSIT